MTIQNGARGCQSAYSTAGDRLFHGFWDPRNTGEVAWAGNPGYWRDRPVLVIGAETSGLSLEFARQSYLQH